VQIAHGDQAVVSLDHGEAADLVGIGERADRGQFGARPQMMVVDLALDAGDDLIGERLSALVADSEREHAGFSLTAPAAGLARLPDQYSYGP
jgi:hypothetical protein